MQFGHHGPGCDQRSGSDHRAVHDHGRHPDQAAVTDGAAVQHGGVSDRDVVADDGRASRVRVHDHVVLQVGSLPDPDRLGLGPQDRPVPERGVVPDRDITDDPNAGRHPGRTVESRPAVSEGQDQEVPTCSITALIAHRPTASSRAHRTGGCTLGGPAVAEQPLADRPLDDLAVAGLRQLLPADEVPGQLVASQPRFEPGAQVCFGDVRAGSRPPRPPRRPHPTSGGACRALPPRRRRRARAASPRCRAGARSNRRRCTCPRRGR